MGQPPRGPFIDLDELGASSAPAWSARMAQLTALMRLTRTTPMVDRTLASVDRVRSRSRLWFWLWLSRLVVTEAIKFNHSNLTVPASHKRSRARSVFYSLEQRQFPKRSFGDLGACHRASSLASSACQHTGSPLHSPKSYRLWGIDRLLLSPRPARFVHTSRFDRRGIARCPLEPRTQPLDTTR